MAWVSFALVFTLARDLALVATLWTPAIHAMVASAGVPLVLGGSVLAMVVGAAAAFRGPRVERVTCYKLTAEHAERTAEIWARRWVDMRRS